MIAKRSIILSGKKTSINLEEPFWKILKEIVGARNESVTDLVAEIAKARGRDSNLSSAIRLFILDHVKRG